VFETLAPTCPHFMALVVEATWGDGDDLDCGGFIRTRQIDVFGQTKYVGVQVEKSAVKYYVPSSDVLVELEDESPVNY
jgi:hypothetical protein